MNFSTYEQRLRTLQCHFTWDFESKGNLNIHHILQILEGRLQCQTYQNLSTLYNLKAFLLHQLCRSSEALECLHKAKEIVRRDCPSTFKKCILATYGNYAWIYFYLDNFDKMERYLRKIANICADYPEETAEMYAEQGWSFLLVGNRYGDYAKMCFTKALENNKGDYNLQWGLACATYAHARSSGNGEVRTDAIKHLDEIVKQEPENWEARVYLARMLQDIDDNENQKNAYSLLKDCIQKCSYAFVLKVVAELYKILSVEERIDVLNRALELAPNYYYLFTELGNVYRHEAIHNNVPKKKLHAIQEAIKIYKRYIQVMPWDGYARIDLATMYGLNKQIDFQEMVYLKMDENVLQLGKKCQQLFYSEYAKFCFYTKGWTASSVDNLKKGFAIDPNSVLGKKCRIQLMKTAARYNSIKEEIEKFIENIEKQ